MRMEVKVSGFFGEEAVKEVGWAGGRGLRGVGIFLKREIRKWTIEENWLRVLASNLAEMKKFSFPLLDFSAEFFFPSNYVSRRFFNTNCTS